jgi:NAD(P)-dependent dehydrogenase (short-subunit alcohol dehydrogenase family)
MLKVLFQPLNPPHLPPANTFHNQTVLVTGSNTGLGRETVRHALSLGASNIIMGVRSLSKGKEARDDILSSIPNAPEKTIEVWELDMSNFQSVVAFARRVKDYVENEGRRLDVAIMNAGIASLDWNVSADNWELSIQVNGLSTALLSLELLPILVRQSSSQTLKTFEGKRNTPRLMIVASDVHQAALFPQRTAPNVLAALNDKTQWEQAQAKNPIERYGVSKLFSQWINIELSKLVPVDQLTGKPSVVVTSATPGLCASELMREGTPWVFRILVALFARTSKVGSKAIVDAAARDDGHGKWFENQKPTE